jgi:hypothetical protein
VRGRQDADRQTHRPAATGHPMEWRWGLDSWGAAGPTAAPPPVKGGGTRGVLQYLARYRSDLEAELHSALVHAYLGPRWVEAPPRVG